MVTEGVLTRRLQQDPELPGVGLVVFDEVHERNLTTDLGLALTLDAAATLRPDLRILAMSATADTASFARLLGDAPIVESAGQTYPVDIRWRPRTRDNRIEPAVVSAVLTALRDDPGDVLAFLPGIAEISRTAEQLAGVGRRRAPLGRCARRPTSRTARWRRRRLAAGASCWPRTSPRRR